MVTFSYSLQEASQQLRGDIDQDGQVGMSDITALIDYLLSADATGISVETVDVDQDGITGIADVYCLLDYVLKGSWE
jgi:hypothetical protein